MPDETTSTQHSAPGSLRWPVDGETAPGEWQTVIFCSSEESANQLAQELRAAGFQAAVRIPK